MVRLFILFGWMIFPICLQAQAQPQARAQTKKTPKPLLESVVMTQVEERIRHYAFPSQALKKNMAFSVVFPTGYEETGKPWPVLFFLHGLGRNEKTLIEDPESKQKLLAQPYVIVLPKGENGWYFDSPFDERRQYASYLDEVIGLAGKTVHISADRSQRAVGGWSAGGFGSVWACLRHPESFSTLATIIAVVDFPAPEARFPRTPETFGTDPSRWPEFNPINRAEELRGKNVLLVIGEKATDAVMNDRLSARLKAADIPHETVRLPGGHTFPSVQGGVGPVCAFVAKHLQPR